MLNWDEKTMKGKTVPKNVKEQIWKIYMKDKPEGKCYCCRAKTITFFDFEVGHNKAKSKGDIDSLNNLRPICNKCNSSMGTMSIETYRAFGRE